MRIRLSEKRRAGGTALVGVMIGLVLSSLLLSMTGSLWLFGSRSLVAMGNYPNLDARSRHALDPRSRDIRPATQVTGVQNSGTTKWLRVTNPAAGRTITCTWHATPRTLVCQKTGQPDQDYCA